MDSRERVRLSLNHQEADRIPLDLGASPVTGMHVSTVYLLRQALGLDAPGTPVKVVEPFQMMGEIAPDLVDALGADVLPLQGLGNLFGFRNEGWKPWTLFDGTPVLVPAGFNTEPEPDGSILMYPGGDHSVAPSGKMPKDGFYFDPLIRQEPIDDEKLNVEDNVEEFGPLEDDELNHLAAESRRLYEQTDKAIVLTFGGAAFGDIALVPAPWFKHPKGIRDFAEWYMSTMTRQDYIYKVFERQCEIAMENLEKIYEAVGNRVSAAFLMGADFGMQTGPFIAREVYRSLYLPHSKRVNDWIHKNTTWKTMMHSCGGIMTLIDDFIEAGWDILNPVQCSAGGMDPGELKRRFGARITFWGGAVNTQQTLPYGTPEDVRREVRERMRIFGPGGGFIFNPIHNVQAKVPIGNILAMYETQREFGRYPLAQGQGWARAV
jgi:hypothetical protein